MEEVLSFGFWVLRHALLFYRPRRRSLGPEVSAGWFYRLRVFSILKPLLPLLQRNRGRGRERGRKKRERGRAVLFVGHSIKPAPFDGSRVPGASGPPEPFGGCLNIFLQADAILETAGVKEHSVWIPLFGALFKQVCRHLGAALNALAIHIEHT